MIDINDITVRIGSKVLLENASAHLSDGWKIGIVGANGCGKSTLFKVLLGELETETGEVFFPREARVSSVAQEIKEIDLPVLEFVLSQDKERSELLKKLETAPETELAEIHERLNIIEASSAEARASAVLRGLGFGEADLSRPVREFSGGWRMRLALAAALFRPSDILLLDEPTNHLDLEASVWLENHLKKYRGTLLLISHDKYILNDLCGCILHFEGRKLNVYSGNYDTFRRTRAEQRQVQAKRMEKQEQQRRHLQSFVDRFRYKASKAKQAQSRIKMLEKMEVIAPLTDEYNSHFSFPEPEELAPPLLSLEGVSTGYGDNVVLKNLTFRIVNNDRIALLGANGNGKSTLAKLLSGRLKPFAGELRCSQKLKVGYFAQHQSEELPLDETPAEYMLTLMPEKNEAQVRAHLARFGLSREKSVTKIGDLSGGEKARLLFAAMTYNAPALLILDEPTNHLDIEGREALTEALNAYSGSVILITHDLHLVELIADDLWLIKNHTCKAYNGDLEDYKKSLLEKETPVQSKTEKKPETKKENAYFAARQLTSELKKLEKKLEKLNAEKQKLENKFLEPLSVDETIALQKEFSAKEQQLSEAETDWLTLSEQLEQMS